MKQQRHQALARLPAARLLEARRVEVISGRGRSVVLASVRCPARARSTPVEDCAHCGEGDGFARDALSRGEFLSCRCTATPPLRARDHVRDAMPSAAVVLRPRVSQVVAADALRARGLPAAAVVDGEGRPIGVVSEVALLRAHPGATVADAMTRLVPSVHECAPIERAAALMAARRVDLVVVVSDDGIAVGALSALDVVAALQAGDGPLAIAGAAREQPDSCDVRPR